MAEPKKFAWVIPAMTGITALLTWYSSYTAGKVDEKQKNIDDLLKSRSVAVNEEQARLTRLEFVDRLLPSLSQADSGGKDATINLIRLTLSDSEAERFFAGLTLSSNMQLKQVGDEGINTTSTAPQAQIAVLKEHEGYRQLVAGNFDSARKAFDASEKALPKFHASYEIGNLLRTNQSAMLQDTNKRKQLLREIGEKYSAYAPQFYKEKVLAKK